MAKEPYFYDQRALNPIFIAKEPYFYDKRALFLLQKSPISLPKEPYL